MGYRNRMLGGLEDAIRFATEARDLMAEMNRNEPDTDEAVRATIDALGALHHVLSEWYDSTSPVPKSTLGPDEEG